MNPVNPVKILFPLWDLYDSSQGSERVVRLFCGGLWFFSGLQVRWCLALVTFRYRPRIPTAETPAARGDARGQIREVPPFGKQAAFPRVFSIALSS